MGCKLLIKPAWVAKFVPSLTQKMLKAAIEDIRKRYDETVCFQQLRQSNLMSHCSNAGHFESQTVLDINCNARLMKSDFANRVALLCFLRVSQNQMKKNNQTHVRITRPCESKTYHRAQPVFCCICFCVTSTFCVNMA